MRVIVTGASGVLGTQVYDAFVQAGHEVVGLAHSRASDKLKQVDLMDQAKRNDAFEDPKFKADWVIHCAAERRPDVAEKDPDGARMLNVDVPESLAQLSKRHGFTLIYISTDYVFDGTSPPYTPSSVTNPIQLYGQTKRDGEVAVLGVDGAKAVVLRVPVLYGPAPKNSDSAVNILLDVVQDQSGKQYTMDHYATRYPTNVIDIASFLVRLSGLTKDPLPPIIHYSAAEPFTKYEMCLIFSQILSLPHKHIVPDAEAPKSVGTTTRPKDCQLYTRETENLLPDGDLRGCGFEEWWRGHLGK